MANVKYDVYEEVTAQIIAALEKGVKPWECPWVSGAAGMPLRASGEAYRGINSVLLSMVAWQKGYTNPTWLTFNQAKNLGGMVRKGEKSALVVKYGTFEAVCETAVETDGKFILWENTNGLIRQYLPKGKSFDDLTDLEVQIIMDRLNNKPRKCLGFRTPNQVFLQAKSDLALAS